MSLHGIAANKLKVRDKIEAIIKINLLVKTHSQLCTNPKNKIICITDKMYKSNDFIEISNPKLPIETWQICV